MSGDRSRTFLNGAATGVTSALLLQPLEVLQSRAQGQVLTSSVRPSIANTAVSVWKESGVGAFWRGLSPSIARSALGPGVYFVVLEEITDPLRPSETRGVKFLQGAAARAVGSAVTCPLTVIKTRYELSRQENPSVLRGIARLVRVDGFRGLFAGLQPMLLRDVPRSGMYLFLFADVFRPAIKLRQEQLGLNLGASTQTAISAILAGLGSTIVTHPADVVRTNFQMSKSEESILAVCSRLVRVHGVRGLFTGVSTRIVRTPLRFAITWTLYDFLQRLDLG